MSWVGLAGILGYIAGLFSFRLKSRWCPVCGDILRCVDCARRASGSSVH